jgi:hypothetical protein
MLNSAQTQIHNGSYITANVPVGIFEVGDGTKGLFNVLATGQASAYGPVVSGLNGGTAGSYTVNGSTSGSAKIQAAAAQGTPQPIQLPTATGTSGQFLQTDGGTPQQTSWQTIAAGATGATGPAGATGASGAAGGGGVGNTTPVTVSANTTADQTLMELALPAGLLNTLKQQTLLGGSGIFTIAVAQTPTLTWKVKLCTVSGCGSGTVVTLASFVNGATVAATNNPWNMDIVAGTAATGATGNLIVHGSLNIDIGALTTTAGTVYNDTNTAVSANIDLTAALFVDFTVASSTGNTGNTFTQQDGMVQPNPSASAVTTVFGQTGAVPNLSGDVTTSGSSATLAINQHPTRTALTFSSSPYTVLAADSFITVDATSGVTVVNLPATTGARHVLIIKKTDASTNAVSITPNGSDTIDLNAGVFSLNQQNATIWLLDGTAGPTGNWQRLHVLQMAGDVSGPSTAAVVGALNGTSLAGLASGILKVTTGTGAVTSVLDISGTSAMGTGAIASATCATVVTAAATGTATTSVITASFNGDPTAVTGYIPSTAGMLTIISYPTANNVNFKVCNNTGASITPGAITLNWRVR